MRSPVGNPLVPGTAEALRQHLILCARFTLTAGALLRAYGDTGLRP